MTLTSTVRAELLDCVQANLAVLADRRHGPGTYLALGAVLRFRPRPADPLPTVEPPAVAQVRESTGPLGMSIERETTVSTPAELRTLAERHGTLYLLADSFEMPWLPYFGRRHMDHSFLVEARGDRADIVDGYHNQTQWGPATPGCWELAWHELPFPSYAVVLTATDAGPADHPPVLEFDSPTSYLDAYATHDDRSEALERLAVETWLLARSHGLHAAYLSTRGHAVPNAHLQRWAELAGSVFIALRRVQRGRPEPPSLLTELAELLATDHEVFGTSEGAVHSG